MNFFSLSKIDSGLAEKRRMVFAKWGDKNGYKRIINRLNSFLIVVVSNILVSVPCCLLGNKRWEICFHSLLLMQF